MKIIQITSFLLALSISTYTATAEASAGKAWHDAGEDISDEVESSADETVEVINKSADSIIKVITSSADMQKTAETAVSAQIADDSNRKATGRNLAKAASEAGSRYQLPVHACTTLTSASKIVGNREQGQIISNNLGRGLTYRNLNSKAPKEESRDIFQKHVSEYCGPGTAKSLGCKPTDMPEADIKIDSLLSGAGLPGKQPDYTFSARQISAGKAYIRTVIDPLPIKNISPAIASTPAGQEYIVKQLSRQAKLSLAAKPFVDAVAWRTPLKGAGQSPFEFLQTEVDRRAGNPQWMIDMGASSPEARNTEIAYMQALQLQLDMDAIVRTERIEMLYGAVYAELIKQGSENDQFTTPEIKN